ncbi:hypothetical protein [Candidatus Odyssella thessalonicensis]|uniref:hypothetical protein n=1 Tax=Candidatus Odyssella thessalonicensis TaxID=84647 RepID=UPI000225BB43|nr:hypothetical protein [Candidatus Odyssella thessalonicensis]
MVDKEDFDYILSADEINQIFNQAKRTLKNNEGYLPEEMESKVGDAIADHFVAKIPMN